MILKRCGTSLALFALAAGIAYGLRIEQSLNIPSYYRQLGSNGERLSAPERFLFSILLAAGDRLHKHKGQAHASLPFVEHQVSA